MPNAAARLLNTLTRALAASGGSTAYHVWSGVFEAGSVPEPARQFEVLRLLGLLREEVVAVRRTAAGLAVRPSTYEAQLNSVEQALLPGRFHNNWSDSTGYLTRDALLALTFLADLLPEDETALPGGALESLLEEVAALEKLVREIELPAELQRFVLTQLDAIRAAAREYPIRGAAGLRSAFARAVFEWERDFSPAPSASSVATGFRRVLAKVALIMATAGTGMATLAQLVKNVREIQTSLPAVAQDLGVSIPNVLAPRQLSAGAPPDAEEVNTGAEWR